MNRRKARHLALATAPFALTAMVAETAFVRLVDDCPIAEALGRGLLLGLGFVAAIGFLHGLYEAIDQIRSIPPTEKPEE